MFDVRCSISKKGFTLLEILMVVLVIGIATAVMVPEAMHAVEGSHLRDSLEKIVSLNRYARARALLDRQPYALLYHGDTMEIELVALPPRQETPSSATWTEPPPRAEDAVGVEASGSGMQSIRSATLHDSLELRTVKGAAREEDTWFVVYTDSGMTDPHTVEILSPGRDTTYVRVNGITGEIAIRD